jgi:hypothetical protein
LTCSQATTQACPTTGSTTLNSIDLLAVQQNFDAAAATVLAGSDPALTPIWNPQGTAPDGSTGWWASVGAEPIGRVFIWTVNDMPDLAAFGLDSAALCDSAGANCVQPSVSSVSAALSLATTDSSTGMEEVNPATVETADDSPTPAGAYPLVDVVYAAVPTDQSAAALTSYANFISYAANQGQTAGTAAGDLPAGYLPLTSALQAQANSVVTQLQALAGPTASPTASPTTSATPTQSSTQTSTGTGSTSGTGETSGTGSTLGTGETSGTGSTSGRGSTSGTGSQTTPTTVPATHSSATSTCTPASPSTASQTASPSKTAGGAQAPTPAACASSSPTPQSFDVLPPSAQAAAGITQGTAVGSVRGVLIIVLIIGAAGALAGALLRYGRVPGRGRGPGPRADGS